MTASPRSRVRPLLIIADIVEGVLPRLGIRDYDDEPAGVEWLAIIGESVEEMLAQHRLTGTVCECTRHFHNKHGHRVHVGLSVAEDVGNNPRAAAALIAYQTNGIPR